MRTISIPPLVLCLLTPLFALAQVNLGQERNSEVIHSPLFWYWMVALAIAVVAFIVTLSVFSRRRRGPPSRPRIS